MNARKLLFAVGATLMTLTGAALASLQEEDVGIRRVDVKSPDDVVIHIDRAVPVPSCAGSNDHQIGCDLDDKYCDPAMRIALSAQLSGRKIAFDVSSSECVGGIAKFTRLRNNNL